MASLRTIGFLCVLGVSGAEAQDAPRAGVAAWDTGRPSPDPLAAEALDQKAGRTKIDAPVKPGDLKGDLAVTNGRLLTMVRQKGPGPELYSLKSGKSIYRSRLLPAAGGGLESVALTEL